MERAVAPVGRHLATAGRGIAGRAHGLLKHFMRGDAERQAKGAVAVIKVEGVLAGAQGEAGRDLNCLMARSADLKKDATLAFEGDFAIVEAPGGIHEAERADELFGIEAFMSSGGRGLGNWRSGGHRWRIPLHQFNREAGRIGCESWGDSTAGQSHGDSALLQPVERRTVRALFRNPSIAAHPRYHERLREVVDMRKRTIIGAAAALCAALAFSVFAAETGAYSPALWSGMRYRMIGPNRGGRLTTDAGHTWQNISDAYFTVASIGAVEVSLSKPDTVYAGTGSSKIRSNVSIGRGMYKSTDAGRTWAW